MPDPRTTRVRVNASLQAFDGQDILNLIPASKLAEVKASDPHPVFKAYVIGHEGEAKGVIAGYGKRILQYFQDAIVGLTEKMKEGTKVFLGHQPGTNSHEGRTAIGEIVGKTLKSIAGRLSSVAIVYVKPEARSLDLDVASIETDVTMEERPDGSVRIVDFGEITGLALGNHVTDAPGFPGATLLGALQAFTQSTGENKVELKDIIAAIQAGKFTPDQIFTPEQLISAAPVVEHVRKEKQQEYEHARRVETKLGEERTASMAKEKELTDKINELQKQTVQLSSAGIFGTAATERKLTDLQKKFIEKNLGNFKTDATEPEKISKAMGEFIDSQLVEFADWAKMFNVQDPQQTPANNQQTNPPNPPANTNQGAADPKDLSDKANNPLIP